MKIYLIVAFLFGVLVGLMPFILSESHHFVPDSSREKHASNDDNFFTNPLLECEEFGSGIFGATVVDLEKSLKGMVTANVADGTITRASIYFRDLNNGPWIGINESETFIPASLLKIPLAMALYEEEEKNPTFLSKQILYSSRTNEDKDQPYPPKDLLMDGKSYLVSELHRGYAYGIK